MEQSIRQVLMSVLYRTLEVEPELGLQDAVERVAEAATASDLLAGHEEALTGLLATAGTAFRQRAVVNPAWLAGAAGKRFYFFLMDAQPGWLRHLVGQVDAAEGDLWHYVVFGAWDALVVLIGTDDDALHLRERMSATGSYDLTHFLASAVPLFYRYVVPAREDGWPTVNEPDHEALRRLAGDYGCKDLVERRTALETATVLLGPTWTCSQERCARVEAFVGISLRRGRQEVSTPAVVASLLQEGRLRSHLVHLFEIANGYPFHYLAKLACKDIAELDEATDALAYARVGRVSLESTTLVVARGSEDVPVAAPSRPVSVAPTLDTTRVEQVADEMIVRLGMQYVSLFNELSGTRQLVVLRSLDELYAEAEARGWDDRRETAISSALDAFARASIEGPEVEALAGAVMVAATGAEDYVLHALRKLGRAVYGTDLGRAQKEFRLPEKDFRKLTLGKALGALRTIVGNPDFAFAHAVLADPALDMAEGFSRERNKWAHVDIPADSPPEALIDGARRALLGAIQVMRWIGEEVLPVVPTGEPTADDVAELVLPEAEPGRPARIFLSHSKLDVGMAQRIAAGLRAFDLDVWYDEWAIRPGDSIVARISEGLAQTDVLVVLLSPNSVSSDWVAHELTATLMRQLRGQDVALIPVLVAECEVPTALSDIKYVDLAADFQRGFIQLLEALSRKPRRPRSEGAR